MRLLLCLFLLTTCYGYSVSCPNSNTATVTIDSTSSCKDLIAGQNIRVGEICLSLVSSNIVATYNINSPGWEVSETHLWIGTNQESYPQTRQGNPKVGNFPYSGTALQYTVPLSQFVSITDPCTMCSQSFTLYFMAHASVYLVDEEGTVIQSETAWSSGRPVVEKGSWATQSTTYVKVLCTSEPEPPSPPQGCETAFAKLSSSTCFLNIDENADGFSDFNRWGWTSGPLSQGTYTFDIYSGAGQCDITKGTRTGTLTVVYSGSTVTVTYNLVSGYQLKETHLYVGNEILPRNVNNLHTVAPGQYPYIHENLSSSTDTYTVTGVSGNIYVVAHAVTCSQQSK